MNLNLKGKKVFITASSAGIGRATAESFLMEGSIVVMNGRNKEKLNSVVIELKAEYGEDRVLGFVGNMSETEDICSARRFIEDKIGVLDVLVGNLGTGKGISSNKLDIDEWNHMLKNNLLCTVQLIDQFLELLQKSENSSIVLLSSLAAMDKIGAPPAYAAAKGGILSLVKYLADEYAGMDIRVNGVAPGNVFYKGGRWEELSNENPHQTKEYIESNVPLKRFGKPEEIADAITFLASERASFITGTVLKVDGGQSRSY